MTSNQYDISLSLADKYDELLKEAKKEHLH